MAFKMKGFSGFKQNQDAKEEGVFIPKIGDAKDTIHGPRNKIVSEQGKIKKEVRKVNKPKKKKSTIEKVLRTVTDIANPGAAIIRKGKEYYDKNIKGTTKEVTIRDKDGNVIKTKKRQR
jgi:hypothetical protein